MSTPGLNSSILGHCRTYPFWILCADDGAATTNTQNKNLTQSKHFNLEVHTHILTWLQKFITRTTYGLISNVLYQNGNSLKEVLPSHYMCEKGVPKCAGLTKDRRRLYTVEAGRLLDLISGHSDNPDKRESKHAQKKRR